MSDSSQDGSVGPQYRSPKWLPGRHLQTLYPYLFRKQPLPGLRRERWDTPDGDFVDVDWLEGAPTAPLVVLFHGLEGCSHSHYARALLRQAEAIGWSAAVPHFRGCSGVPNLQPRAYHSGDYLEIDWILQRFSTLAPARVRFAAGVSLGGNALLKWLAHRGVDAGRSVAAAACVSAPVDLQVAGHRLARGFNRLYTWHFLRSLKRKSLAKLDRFPRLYDAQLVASARTLHAFDSVVTAPLHGFRDADDYWTRASSKRDLLRIALPTLVVHARNDPFLPGRFLPAAAAVAASVRLEFTNGGGHAGFVSGPFPGHIDWLPRRLLRFFQESAMAKTGTPAAASTSDFLKSP